MKVVLNLASLTEYETLGLAQTIITELTGNATFTPKPTLAQLTGLLDTAQQASNDAAVARQASATATTVKDNAFAALRAGLSDEAATVESTVDALPASQQEAAVQSAGMAVQDAPTRLTALGAVEDLALTAGDLPGTLDWHCHPVPRKSFYVVEFTTAPVSATTAWVPTPASTKSSGTLTGLPSGASVSVRVHAEGTRGVAGAPGVAGPKVVP